MTHPRLQPSPKASLVRCQARTAQLVANVKGAASPAAIALQEFKLRTATGELVIVFSLRGRWLVGTEADIQVELRAFSARNLARLRKD